MLTSAALAAVAAPRALDSPSAAVANLFNRVMVVTVLAVKRRLLAIRTAFVEDGAFTEWSVACLCRIARWRTRRSDDQIRVISMFWKNSKVKRF